jgi:ribosomal-protein-alanine N-acetyltransferase
VNVVPMTRGHVDALMPFEQQMFETEAWSRSSYLAELGDTRHRHYVAAESDDGMLLGWAGVRVVADEAEILTVGVVPAARRQGIGRLLLADLLAHARERGARQVYLEVRVDNAAALALYESDGFARVGLRRGYYANGRVDGVTMHRAL